MRIGSGYDSHVFEEGRRLVLGGVEIPGCPGLKAHSDGDVLAHAVIDALLGAAALGDIGKFYPDSSPEWKDADSMKLLAGAAQAVRKAGYGICNLDATLICEKPRIAPHADAMRERIAAALAIGKGCVSVKGKTNEKMDDVGAGKGIVAHAVVLLD